jgi:hypothetical protein
LPSRPHSPAPPQPPPPPPRLYFSAYDARFDFQLDPLCNEHRKARSGDASLGVVETVRFVLTDIVMVVLLGATWHTIYVFSQAKRRTFAAKLEAATSACTASVRTPLDRTIYISLFFNVAVVAAASVVLAVVSLDAVQTAFSVHMFFFCITCAVLVWTKPSWNIFCLSAGVPAAVFMGLVHLIWNCEAFFGGFKVVIACVLVFCTRFMRIGGSRLLHTLIEMPKTRVQVTMAQYLMGASMVLVASLHLAFPSYESISFAEIVLWVCFLADILWHFRVWKMDMKRAFQSTETLNKIVSKGNLSLKVLNDVKRRQIISTIVGVLVVEIFLCVYMILANSVIGLQEARNECARRSPRGSDRLALILFPVALAAHIAFWMLIYAHVTSQRRDILKRTKCEPHPVLPESSLISQVDSTCT